MQNVQRPISKYQRNQQDKKDANNEQENKELNEIANINIPDLITRLDRIIKKNKITKSEFCDNTEIFLDINDFKELFRKIHFAINNSEVTALFNYRNPSAEEGFILGKTFFNSHKLAWKEISLDKIDNEYDIKKINDEFKVLQDEVFQVKFIFIFKIVSKETKANNSKSRPITTNNNKRALSSTKATQLRPITAVVTGAPGGGSLPVSGIALAQKGSIGMSSK